MPLSYSDYRNTGMPQIRLTEAKLAALKAPESGKAEISVSVVPGLRVRVGVTGGRTFIVRKRVGGRVKTVTLGGYSARFGLADARKKARVLPSESEAGGDPSGAQTGNAERGPSGFSKTVTRPRAPLEARVEQLVAYRTLHDLRRTLATGLQRLGVRREVTEAVLNHVSGSRAGIVGVYSATTRSSRNARASG